MRPITIAGGGLAGLSLGIALRQRAVPVTVCEATSYPRHRVCGEFISGVSTAELDTLGIADLMDPAPRHRSTAWFDQNRLLLQKELPADAMGLSRHFLDSALADRFQAIGGRLVTGERVTQDTEGLVWATGRMKGESPWMGLKAHFTQLPLTADLEVHLSDSAYVGLTRVENDEVNFCGLFRRDRPAIREGNTSALHSAIRDAGFTGLLQRMDGAELNAPSLKGVNHFALGWQVERPGAVCIGDAAAMIPPFTGNGMTMAFQSAVTALPHLLDWSAGSHAWVRTSQLIDEAQRRRFNVRLRWARLLQALLMRRSTRTVLTTLLARDWLPFEPLYHKLR